MQTCGAFYHLSKMKKAAREMKANPTAKFHFKGLPR
jgi:hypothetical protein